MEVVLALVVFAGMIICWVVLPGTASETQPAPAEAPEELTATKGHLA